MHCQEQKGNIASTPKQPIIHLQDLIQTRLQKESTNSQEIHVGLQVYRISNSFKKISIPKEEFGLFSQNASYLVFYTYQTRTSGVDKAIAYFWQGSESSIIDKGTSAWMTVDLSKEFGGEVAHQRVEQGKEPCHFIQLFNGMVIRNERSKDPCLILDIRSTFYPSVAVAYPVLDTHGNA